MVILSKVHSVLADSLCMPENTISSPQQLGQALAQLNQLAPQSDLAKAGAQVIVKHLAGNQMSLSNISGTQSVTLAKTDLSSALHSNQTYQVKVSQNGQNAQVQFYPQVPQTKTVAPLTTTQLDGLLKLPAQQLVAGSIPPQLLKITALVEKNANNQLTLSIVASQPKQVITLATPNGTKFAPGSQVTLELKPQASNWQASIKPSIDTTHLRQGESNPRGTVSQINTKLSADQALPLLKTLLAQSQGQKPLMVNSKTLGQYFSSTPGADNKALAETLAKLNSPLGLSVQTDNKGALLALATKASGQITASEQNVKTLLKLVETLHIPLSKGVERTLANMLSAAQRGNPIMPSGQSLPPLPTQSTPPGSSVQSGHPPKTDAALQTNPLATATNNPKPVLDNPETIASLSPRASEVRIETPQMSPGVKAQAIEVLHSLLRVVQARAEVPSDSLLRILTALGDPQLDSEPALKQLTEQLVQQVKQGIPQGKEQDASQIRQLLTNPTLSLTSAQILSPVPSQGFLGGLLSLVQISLASRLSRTQPTQAERLADALSPLAASEASGAAKSATGVSSKGLKDFSQIEQKHQLLRELSRLFAGHQTSKLGNAEQLLQGQDTFHYTIPTAFGDSLQNIELLLKRERPDSGQDANQDEQKNRLWQLTMKLSVGEMGELLTKAKLRQDTLEIDFYTSNESTKDQVLNFLPLLKQRLTILGIDVAKSSCQLGKIPDTLQQRPYHLVQTKV